MEEIFEGLFRVIGSVLRHVLFEILFNLILFNLGRMFYLVITLGQYPKGIWLKKHENRISFTGLFIVVATWVLIFIYNRSA